MDLNNQLTLSFYKEISTLNAEHQIYLVQHINTKKLYVKKILNVYNLNVYQYLKDASIPGLPLIYEIVEDKNQLILIEEYISGDTLEFILENNGPLSESQTINYTKQLCSIISSLHNCNPAIVHRDIKPSNIIISPGDKLILLDLNAAKYMNLNQEEDTTLLGTKGYAAPEQYGFGPSNNQTDIYAIGMLMNTMLLGKFSSEFYKSNTSTISTIITKCTELSPKNRYNSISDVEKALIACEKPFIHHPFVDGKFTIKDISLFIPPGFRSRKLPNMMLASLVYAFIIWLSVGLNVKDVNYLSLIIEKIFCFFILTSIVCCTFNYLNIHSYIPLCKSNNKVIKILGIILLNLVSLIYLLLMMIFIVSITSRLY